MDTAVLAETSSGQGEVEGPELCDWPLAQIKTSHSVGQTPPQLWGLERGEEGGEGERTLPTIEGAGKNIIISPFLWLWFLQLPRMLLTVAVLFIYSTHKHLLNILCVPSIWEHTSNNFHLSWGRNLGWFESMWRECLTFCCSCARDCDVIYWRAPAPGVWAWRVESVGQASVQGHLGPLKDLGSCPHS